MSKIEIRNLFLTRTALGVYITALSAISSVAIGMAQEFDETGKLTVSDWVIGASTVVLTLTGGGVVMSSRIGANGSLAYTPPYVWGPNKSDVINQASRISKEYPREETYVEPPLSQQEQADYFRYSAQPNRPETPVAEQSRSAEEAMGRNIYEQAFVSDQRPSTRYPTRKPTERVSYFDDEP